MVESEKQIATFGSDLLKVKAEKKEIGSRLKTLNENNDSLKNVIDKVNEENKAMTESLRKQKLIISNLENEKIDAEKFKAKIEELESKRSKERENNCNFCEYKTETSKILTDHIRTQHYQDKESQHQELPLTFNEYQCFYCKFKIKSKFAAYNLLLHHWSLHVKNAELFVIVKINFYGTR